MKATGKIYSGMTAIRSDNGGEFVNTIVRDLLLQYGVQEQHCAPYRHVHLIERAIQTVTQTARTLLLDSGLKTSFWAEAVQTAVYCLNRRCTKSSPTKTRYELFHKKKPSVSNLRRFGCRCYVKVPTATNPSIWNEVAVKGIFVGYGEDTSQPTWRVYKIGSQEFVYANSVRFDECTPTQEGHSSSSLEDLFMETTTALSPDPPTIIISSTPTIPTDTSNRAKFEALRQADPVARRTRSARQPHVIVHSEEGYYAERCLAARILPNEERNVPASLKQALIADDAEEWLKAIDSEVTSLRLRDTVEVIPRPANVRVLPVKWVFAIKRHLDGSIARYKARCTILGSMQREGIDYEETFSPVVRYSSLRMLFALAAKNNMYLDQMDVDTAFLYADMPEKEPVVYIEVPYGYEVPVELQGRTDLCCRVKKAIYGLKQSPRLWNKTLDETMKQLDFVESKYDTCIYMRGEGDKRIIVGVYVDDLIIACADRSELDAFKASLCERFSMKDLGSLSHCLGMEIHQDLEKGTVTITQRSYAMDVLKRFGMSDCHPATVPMEPRHQLEMVKSAPPHKFPYREIVGSLMYLMICSRPDLAFSVGRLARHLSAHLPSHHAAALQVLRYLKGTVDRQIVYSRNADPGTLVGYCDSDHASDIHTRRSTTGYVFCIAGGAISWKSKLQPTVAKDSVEAEYMSLSAAVSEAVGLRRQALDLRILNIEGPTKIFCDSSGAIARAKNPCHHQRVKHIDVHHHYIRETVESQEVDVGYIKSCNNLADALTKPLARVVLYLHRDAMTGNLRRM